LKKTKKQKNISHFEKNPQLFFDHWITLLLDRFAVMAADNMADI
jgi:hypothetical protein